MSRPRNWPKEIRKIRSGNGEFVECNEGAQTELAEKLGFEVRYYDLRPETEEKPHNQPKRREKRKKESKTEPVETPQDELTPTTLPPEPDNQPSEAIGVPMPMPEVKPERKPHKKKLKEGFRCKKCGETFEEPLELGNGAFGCPKCRSLQIEPI